MRILISEMLSKNLERTLKLFFFLLTQIKGNQRMQAKMRKFRSGLKVAFILELFQQQQEEKPQVTGVPLLGDQGGVSEQG